MNGPGEIRQVIGERSGDGAPGSLAPLRHAGRHARHGQAWRGAGPANRPAGGAGGTGRGGDRRSIGPSSGRYRLRDRSHALRAGGVHPPPGHRPGDRLEVAGPGGSQLDGRCRGGGGSSTGTGVCGLQAPGAVHSGRNHGGGGPDGDQRRDHCAVCSDLGRLRNVEGQIILGAAIIDDILGLIVLTVVTNLARESRSGCSTSRRLRLPPSAFSVRSCSQAAMLFPGSRGPCKRSTCPAHRPSWG